MRTVMIVEDEPIEAESLRRIVAASLADAEIYEAPTGKKAIELIDELHHIDLMFVDLNIPRPDGRQVIEHLRAKSNATRVIVTSANDDFETVRGLLHLRVEDYLLKPVKTRLIVDKLNGAFTVAEADAAQAEKVRQRLLSLAERCDYPQWHDFLLDYLGAPRPGQTAERARLLLTQLGRQPSLRPATKEKTSALAAHIGRAGLSRALYWRMLLLVMNASAELFDAAYKNSTMDFITRAKFHIERNILGDATLDTVAGKAFISACYLSRMFKKNVGIGFSAYVTRRKIRLARALLLYSDLNINAIAMELCWQDANYFCRLFKKEIGMSPSDYRRQADVS